MRTSSQRVHCREVATADFDAIAGLLAGGFATSREHWLRILKRLEERPAFPSLPRYGYLLECDDGPVGAILLIFSAIRLSEQTTIRCNVCSWHVRPPFNIYAGMLASRALRLKDVTYVNVAPAPNTLPILKAQGYSRYSDGWYAAIPSILGRSRGARVKVVNQDLCPTEYLQPGERELLLAHASYGCTSLICESGTEGHPFVFMRRKFGPISFAYMVYCRDIEDFVRCAGPVGRFLAIRGVASIVLDANAPIRGLIGVYFGGYPKYFKGSNEPRLGDLSYSELAMFRFPGDRVRRDRRRGFPGLMRSGSDSHVN